MERASTLSTDEQQSFTTRLIHAPTTRARPRRVGGVDLDDLQPSALGLVAQDIEELGVGPRAVMVASLFASCPRPLANTVKPLHRDSTVLGVESKPHKLFGRAMLHVLNKPCFPSGHPDEGPRGRTSAFGLQPAPDPPEMLFAGFQVPCGEERSVVSGGGDGEVAPPCVDTENVTRPLLLLIAYCRNVMLVAPSFAAAPVDLLRGLNRPLRVLQESTL